MSVQKAQQEKAARERQANRGLREAFNRIDTSGDGRLSKKEILAVCHEMGFDPSSEEVKTSVHDTVEQYGEAGSDGVKQINFDKFKLAISKLLGLDEVASGLSWMDVGAQKPEGGRELTAAPPSLREALKTKTSFAPDEWKAFGVQGLRLSHYVAVGGRHFQPAPRGPQPVAYLPRRQEVADFYQTKPIQFGIAAVILFNFCAIVVEKEIDPYAPELQRSFKTWQGIDDACNVIFLIELMINLYGNFWRPFVANAWNYLDTVVVIVGLTSLMRIDLGPLKQIKILRAFRILRLFKRVQSLNKILVALLRSIPGVLNALAVMFIFLMIYAIVAVDFFRDFGDQPIESPIDFGKYKTIQRFGPQDACFGVHVNGELKPNGGLEIGGVVPGVMNADDNCVRALGFDGTGSGEAGSGDGGGLANDFIEVTSAVTSMTPRGFHFGQEYFGTLMRSLYTMFQVLTGESWCEMVVRPLLFGWTPTNAFVVGLFFTSFVVLTGMIMQNVVVTVLLDKFLADDDPEQIAEAQEAAENAMKIINQLKLGRNAEAFEEAVAESPKKLDKNGQLVPDSARAGAPAAASERKNSNAGLDAGGGGLPKAERDEMQKGVSKLLAETKGITAMLEAANARLGYEGAPSASLSESRV